MAPLAPESMRLVFMFPQRQLTLHSPLSLEQARQALASAVRPGNAFLTVVHPRDAQARPFVGKVEDTRFQLGRALSYRNSFMPVVTGVMAEDGRGTRIEVSMRLWRPTLVFMILWMIGMGGFGLLGISESLTGSVSPKLAALLMVGFGVALTGFAFGSEAEMIERRLRLVLRAHESQ